MIFNCVNLSILLSELRYYGITGAIYSLITSYLEDRHQSVNLVNNDYKTCSSWGIVKYSVPQGSILGLFLFLLYINNITKITITKDNNNKFKLVLFADDTNLIITSLNPANFIKDISMAVTDILIIKRYNLNKVLACSTTFFQLSLFCATFFQMCTVMLFIFSNMSSSQHV